ncbi:MAG: PEP-CTERM sorting domain-containing protein [Cyanobacteria bacterium P01_F01_bin.86]
MAPKFDSSLFKKVNALAAGVAAVCVLGAAAEAQAATLYATDVVYYDNKNDVSESRSITDHALGAPQLVERNTDFMSLGRKGRAVFNFGQDFSGEVSIWETTWGNKTDQSQWDERIDIYYGNFDNDVNWASVANDLDQWASAGEIFNIRDNAFNSATGASNAGFAPEGVFNHVLLVDKSAKPDGFDVNAIAVQGVEKQEVPEPTALAGLFMVGALGLQTRRKRSAA